MKISVSYNERIYGNSIHSDANEIIISGNRIVRMQIKYKQPQQGRSWDWLSAATVGGAEIEMSIEDAKSLAVALNNFCEASENSNVMEETIYSLIRLRNGYKSEEEIFKEKPSFIVKNS